MLNQLVSPEIAKKPFGLARSVLFERFRGRFEQLLNGLLLPNAPNKICDSFSRIDSALLHRFFSPMKPNLSKIKLQV